MECVSSVQEIIIDYLDILNLLNLMEDGYRFWRKTEKSRKTF